MRAYTSTKLHLILGTIAILFIIWLPDIAGLWNSTASIIMTVLSMAIIIAFYFFLRKVPKHDDDIHFHEKDERRPVRH